MPQTPYELLQSKDKQRKITLRKQIDETDLKRRSVSYNCKREDVQKQNGEEVLWREDNYTLKMACTLKKSYFYRKFLNRTTEKKLTHDQFSRFKHKFDQINKDNETINKSPFFREVWEQQKQSQKSTLDYQKEIKIIVNMKQNSQHLNFQNFVYQQKDEQTSKKKKIETIDNILQDKKKHLDFNLEIQGNKKEVKNKNQPSIKFKKQQISLNQQKQIVQKIDEINENKKKLWMCKVEQKKTFFNKIQQKNPHSYKDTNQNLMSISKGNKNVISLHKNYALNNGIYSRYYFSEYSTPDPTTQRRINKNLRMPTPFATYRNSVCIEYNNKGSKTHRKHKKPSTTLNYMNDIKGWADDIQEDINDINFCK